MELPHTYIIGAADTGTTDHMLHMILAAMRSGEGLAVFDSTGLMVEQLLDLVPRKRRADVIPFDFEKWPLAWNLLDVPPEKHQLTADTIVDAIRTVSQMTGGTAVMDLYTRAAILAALEVGGTLADIPYYLRDETEGEIMADSLSPSPLRDLFWKPFLDISGKERRAETSSTYNKFLPLILDPRIRRVIEAKRSAFSMADVVENNRILLVSLPQGALGMGKSTMTGSLFLSQLHAAAMGRKSRHPFTVFLPRVHSWAWSLPAEMVTSLGEFGVRVVASSEYVSQVKPQLFDALKGNCRSHLFRLSVGDGERFEGRPLVSRKLYPFDGIADRTYQVYPFDDIVEWDYVEPFDHPPLKRSRSDILFRLANRKLLPQHSFVAIV